MKWINWLVAIVAVSVLAVSCDQANKDNGTTTPKPAKVEISPSKPDQIAAKGGSIKMSVGQYSKTFTLSSSFGLYFEKFVANGSTRIIKIEATGACDLCELQLERGTIRSAWGMSPLDNQSAQAQYESMTYLKQAIEDGSSEFVGGLALANLLFAKDMSGNVKAGMSGIHNDDHSVAFFGGGNYEQAIDTALKYANNPSYQASESEIQNMAKFVVTHGGRAILNDVVLRGYIYALGGKFKGEIEATSGVFKNVTSPNGNFLIDDEGKVRIVGTIETSLNGKRIVLDADTQSITLFDEYGRETVKMDFLQDVGESWTYGRILMSRYAGTSNTVQFRTEMIPNYISMENLVTGIRSAYEPEGVMVTTSDGNKDCSMYINSTNKTPTVKADNFWSGSSQGLTQSISISTDTARHSLIFKGGLLVGYDRENINDGN
jgi:hypothetical protein